MCAGYIGLDQELGIGDDDRCDEPRVAVRSSEAVEVFLYGGVAAVWDAIPSQVAGPQVRCKDSELTLARFDVFAPVYRRLTSRERSL